MDMPFLIDHTGPLLTTEMQFSSLKPVLRLGRDRLTSAPIIRSLLESIQDTQAHDWSSRKYLGFTTGQFLNVRIPGSSVNCGVHFGLGSTTLFPFDEFLISLGRTWAASTCQPGAWNYLCLMGVMFKVHHCACLWQTSLHSMAPTNLQPHHHSVLGTGHSMSSFQLHWFLLFLSLTFCSTGDWT